MTLLSVENPTLGFDTDEGRITAVDNVLFELAPGEVMGLVGESGSGKTTLGRALLKAAPITRGSIRFDDGDVCYELEELGKAELKDYRKRARLIFQDPYAALSPRHPYTRALLSAIPSLDPDHHSKAQKLTGEISSPANPPPGCKFHTCCP